MKLINSDKLNKELLDIKDKFEPNTDWKDGFISAMDEARMVVDRQQGITVEEIINELKDDLREVMESLKESHDWGRVYGVEIALQTVDNFLEDKKEMGL